MSEYQEYEYNDTRNTCAELIRAQGEQLRENPAEYIARKYGIRGGADGDTKRIG